MHSVVSIHDNPTCRDLKVFLPPLQVILESKTGQAELELFPRYLLFLRQQPATRSPQSNIWVNMGMTSLRMFPSYLPPPRGNVSLQQDQSKPSTNASLSYPASPLLILLEWADPAMAVLWSGQWNEPVAHEGERLLITLNVA